VYGYNGVQRYEQFLEIGWSAGLGFDLARFSSLLSEHLFIFDLHGAIYIVIFCGASFSLLYLLVC